MFDSRNRFGWCLKYSFTGIPDKKKYICVLILLDFRYATSAKKSKKNDLNGNENWNASDSIFLQNFLSGLED